MTRATYEANGKRICLTCNWPLKECACPVERKRRPQRLPVDAKPVVFLREVDAGTDSACWVVCAKGDPGFVAFSPME